MKRLIGMRDKFDVAFAKTTDADVRHVRDRRPHNPNHFLAIAISYIFANRPSGANCGVGKTIVSSSIIDRLVAVWVASSSKRRSGSNVRDGLLDGAMALRERRARRLLPATQRVGLDDDKEAHSRSARREITARPVETQAMAISDLPTVWRALLRRTTPQRHRQKKS